MVTFRRSFMTAIIAAALSLPGAVHAFVVADFVLTEKYDATNVPLPNPLGGALTNFAYFDFVDITNPSTGTTAGIDIGLVVSTGTVDGLTGYFFEFVNKSIAPNGLAVITQLYFETTGLDASPYYIESSPLNTSADFTIGTGSVGGLGFTVNPLLTSTADAPRPTNGINYGESLLLGFTPNSTDDLLEELKNGDWHIAVKIQRTADADGLGSGQSQRHLAVYNPNYNPQDPGDPIPEPATMVLFGMGSAVLAARMRLSKK